MKRSAIAWLTYQGSDRPRGAWYVWHDGAAYVVSGGPEQSLPGIEQASRVVVTNRSKDTGARLVSWVAAAAVETPGTESWRAAAELLKAERLNAPPGVDLLAAWAEESTITRLTPSGEVLERPGAFPDESLAAPPPDSPATTVGKLPWVAHRRPRRAPDL
ncbi:MAG: hypothetical protein ICV70_00105 [Jiangellaceae bacterium]|nr:hypothetical protein [Jiangellaceae bacterium]